MNSVKNFADLFSALPAKDQRDCLIHMLSSLGNELTTLATLLLENMEEENEEN